MVSHDGGQRWLRQVRVCGRGVRVVVGGVEAQTKATSGVEFRELARLPNAGQVAKVCLREGGVVVKVQRWALGVECGVVSCVVSVCVV